MRYEIISTGSGGNALLLEDMILIDCGVSYKKLAGKQFQIVLLTHVHSDHFCRSTVRRLHEERPLLRFGCFPWMVQELISLGIPARQIDVYELGRRYDYGPFSLKGFQLIHDVPNGGYSITLGDERMMYATDTASIGHVQAPGYDYYFLEANYGEQEIKERIRRKQERGEFCYETRVGQSHLSREQAEEFIRDNAAADSKVIFIHRHEEGDHG